MQVNLMLGYLGSNGYAAPYKAGEQDAADCVGSYASHYHGKDRADYEAGYAAAKAANRKEWGLAA
jgi:hypothetical protein